MWEPYWQRHGTRRPFPALYKAIELYGEENVMFKEPQFVEPGHCAYCGSVITNKRRKRFCCDRCAQEYARITVWGRTRDPYSLRICFRDNFTCQDCGLFLAYKNEYGIYLPIDDGLQVHHIDPVSNGGGDEPDNLVCLCEECHKERHRKLKEGLDG